MKIKAFSEAAIKYFVTNKKHIVISIQNPNCDFVQLPAQESRLDWLGIHCYDRDEEQEESSYNRFLFEDHHARQILNFVEVWKHDIDLIVINCVMGESRSTGVAAALSKILNNDDMYFFKNYTPNMRVYRKILEAYYGTIL